MFIYKQRILIFRIASHLGNVLCNVHKVLKWLVKPFWEREWNRTLGYIEKLKYYSEFIKIISLILVNIENCFEVTNIVLSRTRIT